MVVIWFTVVSCMLHIVNAVFMEEGRKRSNKIVVIDIWLRYYT